MENDDRSLREIDDFLKIPGIGKGTNAIIEEYIEKGSSSLLEELQAEVPEGLIPLLQLPGLGGKRIARLYKELGVKDIHTLEEACVNLGKVATLKGFGKKTVNNILDSIKQVGHGGEITYCLYAPTRGKDRSTADTNKRN